MISPRYRGEKVTNPTKRGATPRQITNDFLATTSLHAVPHVWDAPFQCLRCLWLVIFVVMCVLLGMHVCTIVRKFYAYPTQVTIKIQREDSLEFPAVTVCNQNPIPRSILEKTNLSQIAKLDTEMACGNLNGSSCASFHDSAKDRYEEAILRCSNVSIRCPRQFENFTNSYYGETDYTYNSYLDSQSTGSPVELENTTPGAGATGAPNFEDSDVEYNYDYYHYYDYYFINDLQASQIEDIILKSNVSDLTDVTNLVDIAYNEMLSGENGTKIEDFILECSYDRQNCNITDGTFKTFYNKAYGKCYTFNSKLGDKQNDANAQKSRSVQARRYGSGYGLRLTLNINQSEYVGLLASSYGARITIHTPTETPYPHLDGYDAPPGMATVAAVKMTYYMRLSEPYESKCFDHIPQDYTKHGLVEPGISYTLRGCRIACMDSAMFEKCSCIDQTTFVDANKYALFAKCDVFNVTQRRCLRNVMRQFQYSQSNTEARQCHCSAACNETSYRRTLSMAEWPTRQFVDLYINNMPRDSRILKMYNRVELEESAYGYTDPMETVEQNLVRLHVYYEELNYEYIQEHEAYGLANLLADLGGVIGLYLGLSVSTVLEVFQYIGFLAMFKFYKTKE